MQKRSLLVGSLFAMFVVGGCASVSSTTAASPAVVHAPAFASGVPLDVFAAAPQPKPVEVRKLVIERAYAPIPALLDQRPRPVPPSPR